MFWKKLKKFWKVAMLLAMISFVMPTTAGCSAGLPKISNIGTTDNDVYDSNDCDDVEGITAIYRDIYEEAAETNSLETTQRMVSALGENGYVAVDSENQVDMAGAEQAVEFCNAVDEKKQAELTIIVIMEAGFRKFDLKTENGNVNVVRGYYQYDKNGSFQNRSTVSYPADIWKYTEEGYLFFEGSYFSDENYVLTLSDTPEYTALRVLPLDETCRELNRKYILPVSYRQNNMFLTDWSEEDFGDLEFYDVFDIFYPILYQQPVPYAANENLGVGEVYQVPAEIFENVVMTYFNIDKDVLRRGTIYHSDDAYYEYRPRGFYEVDYSDIPYPEVVSYTENPDGTITLIVNAVYPNSNTSKAYSHRTVIRPLSQDGFEYVSNQMIGLEDAHDVWWHTNRLTKEEWKEIYGGNETESETESESALWFLPQAENCLITETEKDELKDTALTAAEQVREVYKDIELIGESSYGSNIKGFTREQCREVVTLLGRVGYVSVTEDTNMENYEKVEDFYAAYMAKRDAMVTIYDVNRDGLIGAVTFIYRDNGLQTYYVGIGWQEDGVPEIKDTLVSDIAEIKLTEKGYFIYAYEDLIAHSSLRQYWRIKPLSDKCRELTAKYVYGLSYVNYNVLVKNWDSNNVEDILMPCMFEDIYRICTGEILRTENGRIPAETYEKIMTTYFPVSIGQLREKCGYDANSNSYEYEMIFASPYPPFGEVVDYTENADGTITLVVDGVWADYNSDRAFTNRIVVQPSPDGTFRYLSNSIEPKELEVPKGGKGYDLPIDVHQRKEAEDDCKKMMECIRGIYEQADKGNASNVVLSDETIVAMQDKLKETPSGYKLSGNKGETKNPVTMVGIYSSMENFESVDDFLRRCMEGVGGSVVVYEIHSEGGIGRMKFTFDGANMYVLNANAVWDEENEPRIAYISYTRIKEWKYTDKGWFCYKLCVPQYPEVTEIVDGSCLLRVKPMTEQNREMSEKCVLGLAYQGNNLLCSNWDTEHMEDLDYNGLYEYLYAMKYQEKFQPEDYPAGIPKEEFEKLMMEYLPITEEEIQKYAVFDGKNQTYAWERFGCFNYAPAFFGTSVPEVTHIRENEDGTVNLTVDAVCQMILCDDAVITHELTVRFTEDGSLQYLGNKILDDGILYIPDYQYRIIRKKNLLSKVLVKGRNLM